MFSYRKIFKQAIDVTKNYKFLWIFGLFLVLGDLFGLMISNSDNSSQVEVKKSWTWLILLGSFLLLVLYFRAKAGLIVAIKAISDKQPTSWGKAFATGQLFFTQILAISVVVEISLLIIGTLVASPIIWMFEKHFEYRGWVLLVFGSIIFIPIFAIGLFVSILAPMFVVIYDLTIREAILRSLELISKFWVKLVGFGFILFLFELPALFLGVFMLGLQRGLISLVLLGLLFLILQSMVAVFQQTAWVLFFQELIKPQKLEEEEPVVAPEIAS